MLEIIRIFTSFKSVNFEAEIIRCMSNESMHRIRMMKSTMKIYLPLMTVKLMSRAAQKAVIPRMRVKEPTQSPSLPGFTKTLKTQVHVHVEN